MSLLRIGLYLAVVQLFFALTWTVYVIFLPKLAAQAGIAASWLSTILLLDQLVFTACDWGAGVLADRAARWTARLGGVITLITVISGIAFLAMPFAAPGGGWMSTLVFPALIAVWAVTSSALRAPPLVLIGRYIPKPSHPVLAAVLLLGNGLAGAFSPYLTVALRDLDPRLPFALASLAVVAATLGMQWAERSMASVAATAPPAPLERPLQSAGLFLIAACLLALGFQIHFSVNAAPAFLHFAKPADLEYLMPLFWVGFNIAILPCMLIARRFGGLAACAIGAWIAAGAGWASVQAASLDSLIVAQLIAGAGWACVLSSAVTAALAIGRTGREGLVTGAMFSVFAVAALVRIAAVALHANQQPALASVLRYTPAAAWLLAGILLMVAARRHRSSGRPTPANVQSR